MHLLCYPCLSYLPIGTSRYYFSCLLLFKAGYLPDFVAFLCCNWLAGHILDPKRDETGQGLTSVVSSQCLVPNHASHQSSHFQSRLQSFRLVRAAKMSIKESALPQHAISGTGFQLPVEKRTLKWS